MTPSDHDYWDGTGEEPWASRMSTEISIEEVMKSRGYASKLETVENVLAGYDAADKLLGVVEQTPEIREAMCSLIDYKHRLEAENNGETN